MTTNVSRQHHPRRRSRRPLHPGQTVKAYIKLAEGHSLTKDALDAFLADKLSPIEMPKLLEIRDELPKTMIGKLSRKALLDEEAARRAGSGKSA